MIINLSFLEKKSSNEVFQKSEGRYRVLVDNLPVGVCRVTPGPDGRFLMANPAMVDMLGFSSEEELKKIKIRDIYISSEDRSAYSDRLIREDTVRGAELSLRKKDGTPIYCSDSAMAVRDASGRVLYFDCIIEDITEKKLVQDALKKQEERYREILEAIEEAFYECDLKGYITFCNDAVVKLIGYSKEELMGMNYRKLYKDPDSVFETFHQVFNTGIPNTGFALEMIHKNGQTIYGELSVSPINDDQGRVTGFRGVGKDITERMMFEERLKHLSLHDQLTGLYNRTYFEEELQRLAGGRDYPVTIVSIDLDGLKIINDSMGHKQGDQLLKTCGEALKKPLRSSDVLARVGGDEFVIVLPRTDEESGEKIVNRIQVSVREQNEGGRDIPLVISVGAATCNGPEEPLEETYKWADDLMYQSKHAKVSNVRREFMGALMEFMEKNPEKGKRIARVFPGLGEVKE